MGRKESNQTKQNIVAHELHILGSYLSAHVFLNLLNELGERDKMQGLPILTEHIFTEPSFSHKRPLLQLSDR